jgi:hypothetical protein
LRLQPAGAAGRKVINEAGVDVDTGIPLIGPSNWRCKMGIDSLPMIAFLGAADKWLRAVEDRQIERAAFLVSQLKVAGHMLAIDPEFKRIFADHKHECIETDPEQAVLCIDAFFHAVTDAGRPGRYRNGSTLK